MRTPSVIKVALTKKQKKEWKASLPWFIPFGIGATSVPIGRIINKRSVMQNPDIVRKAVMLSNLQRGGVKQHLLKIINKRRRIGGSLMLGGIGLMGLSALGSTLSRKEIDNAS